MKRIIAVALLVVLVLWVGSQQCPHHQPVTPSKDSTKAASFAEDPMISGQKWQADSARIDSTVRASLALQFADSLRQIRTRRGPLPAPSPDSAESFAWWRDRAEVLGVWVAECGAEADSARSAARTFESAYRQTVDVAGQMQRQLELDAVRFRTLAIRFGELGRERQTLSKFHLGGTLGAVGGVDTKGLFAGPGVCGGATLTQRLPLIGLQVATTIGGCAAWDVVKQELRAGPGGSIGLGAKL